jgi:DNA polymerase III sliding clamp (beta) subunit (PCNA family)
MKFVVDTQTLSLACQNVQRAVSVKTSIPAVEAYISRLLREN